MSGADTGSWSAVDTRTRLYYTAILNENLKLVNKFEFNNVWGDNVGGDVGADGTGILRIKNSYADFNLGSANFKVGTQGLAISRGLLFDNDFSGIVATFDAGSVKIPVAWIRVDEDEGLAQDDRDHFGVLPVIGVGEGVTVQPMFIYDKNQSQWDNYYIGVNVDAKMDAASFWGTAVYEFGEIEAGDQDISAFLVAAGASAGPVHGQVFYATGDDDPTDGDVEGFINTAGGSYYWAEILGYGMFDTGAAGSAPGNLDKITNVWAANVGFKVKPMDKLTLTGDLWYAEQAEGDALGTEIDLKASYALMDNLKLDLVAAYLLIDDDAGDEDPMEFGARISFSF